MLFSRDVVFCWKLVQIVPWSERDVQAGKVRAGAIIRVIKLKQNRLNIGEALPGRNHGEPQSRTTLPASPYMSDELAKEMRTSALQNDQQRQSIGSVGIRLRVGFHRTGDFVDALGVDVGQPIASVPRSFPYASENLVRPHLAYGNVQGLPSCENRRLVVR
jgi:hypothetical protein